MSNVIPLSSTCDYLISRAASHRRAGRYDEAMALLTRAKETYGSNEEIEYEAAQVYEAMDCEDEAGRCYLRVVRAGGKYLAQALFQLALTSAQNADPDRAASYYERFRATDRSGIQEEYASLLGEQLRAHAQRPAPRTKRQRYRELERRASASLQIGKAAAAARTISHALRLHETSRGNTLLACCEMVLGRTEEAIASAKKAHNMAKGRIQTLCILADAYAMAGQERMTRKAILIAALRAKETDDLFAVAIECAKHGMDELALQITQRILRREPFHTRVMMIRAAALLRAGRIGEANRLYGRLMVLLPEDTVCAHYFRATKDGMTCMPPPALGLDVTPDEADRRLTALFSALNEEESPQRSAGETRALCALAAWALRSQYSGQHGALMAVVLMCSLEAQEAREVLLDALMDPQITQSLKMAILQVMTAHGGIKPYDVDIGGRLVRLAAGGAAKGASAAKAGQEVVQRAADRLMGRFPDAPSVMLTLWIAYLNTYGTPQKRDAGACAAALELLYHEAAGRSACAADVAAAHGAAARRCLYFAGLIKRAAVLNDEEANPEGISDTQSTLGVSDDELH